MQKLTVGLLASACLLFSACTTNVSRFQMPGTDLVGIEKLYVRPATDERGDRKLRSLIESDLRQRGYEVATRDDATAFGDREYIFDYSADWQWDITWYLLELRVAIYDPADDTLVAQAQSQQSSMARKGDDIVVGRALASLFDDPPVAEGDE